MRRGMVGSFNGFSRFGIEGGSREDGAGHHFEKRRAGGTIDSASLGTKELARGMGRRLRWPKVVAAAARRCWRKTTAGWAFVGRMAEKPPGLVQGFRAGRETKTVLGWSWAT
jgi:hypothetical protein